MKHRSPRGWPLASWIALIASALVTASAVQRAVTIEPLPLPSVAQRLEYPAVAAGSPLAVSAPSPSLPNDPFRLGRLLPNDIAAAAAARPDTVMPVSAVAIRLLGTVVRPAGSFALCQLPSDVPRIVRVGDRLGELTLIVLEQGHVVFQAPKGARLELSLSQPRS